MKRSPKVSSPAPVADPAANVGKKAEMLIR